MTAKESNKARRRRQKEEREEKQIKHRRILMVVGFVLLVVGCGIAAFLSYKPAPTEESVRREFTEYVQANQHYENPAIAEMMQVMQQLIQGEEVKFPECPNVNLQISLKFVKELGAGMAFQPDSVSSDGKEVQAKFNYLVNISSWNKWANVRPMHIWHETFHIKQACELLQQVFQGADPIGFQTLFQIYWTRLYMSFEAYNVGVEGYWYHQDSLSDPLFEDEIVNGYRIRDVWSYFFGTQQLRFWPPVSALPPVNELRTTRISLPEEGGLPDIKSHPNYAEWAEFVGAVYKDHED